MEVRYPPLKRGISAILARYPMKTRQMGAIPPSAILSRKGIARNEGGVSRTGPLRARIGRGSGEDRARPRERKAVTGRGRDACVSGGYESVSRAM